MIVHAVLSLDVGGLERIVVELARRAGPAAVLCIERPGSLAAELERDGVPVVCLHKPSGRHASIIDIAARELQSLAATVLHTHQIGAAYHAAPAAKKIGIPVVHTEHGNAFARAGSFTARLRLWAVYRRAAAGINAFAAVSPEIVRTLRRWRAVPQRIMSVVPNGIIPSPPAISRDDIRRSLGIPIEAFVAGTVGRLDEVKQQHLLLRAAAVIPGMHVLLVGDGPERERLESLAKSLGIGERTHFAGYQPQPADFLAAMDLFALPSRSEGFPVTLLEAWAQRLPVVVSAVGGLTSIVKEGATGLLVPPGETAALATAIRTIANDAALARRLGEAGRAELDARYTFERMAESYRKLYAAAASQRCNSPADQA